MIEFQNIAVCYGPKEVLHDCSFTMPTGGLISVIGPNGSGKTTLLRAAAKQLPLQQGQILIDGVSIAALSQKELARKAAFLPQARPIPSITVETLISHGRFPYLGFSRTMRPADRAAVSQAMELTGIRQWAARELPSLSGGERQRVYIAMALAQETDIILLDEPTTYLDLRYQFDLLDLLNQLHHQGKTIVMVLHDLSLALRYSTQILLLNDSRLLFSGTPEQLLKTDLLSQVFQIQTTTLNDHVLFDPL